MAYETIENSEISTAIVINAALLSKIKNNFEALSESGQPGADGPAGADGLSQIAYIRDQKPAATHGGTSSPTYGWQTRDLNTLSGDTSFISLSGNQFILQPGTYLIEASVPAYQSNLFQAKLKQIETSTDVLWGSSSSTAQAGPNLCCSLISGKITVVTNATTFEIQQYSQTDRTIVGLGIAVNFGSLEVYTQVKIIKIG